jgi:hypothetical protein
MSMSWFGEDTKHLIYSSVGTFVLTFGMAYGISASSNDKHPAMVALAFGCGATMFRRFCTLVRDNC